MSTEHLVVLSVPGLRPGDIDPSTTPTLNAWACAGAAAELAPTFPCVTSPVQASMFTGIPPENHGVIANGFFHRDRSSVEFWVAGNDVVNGEPIWDAIRSTRPEFTSAIWFAQNIKRASADFVVTPAPIHEADGTTKPWCYSKPDELYQQLVESLGHFPLQHYWGPLANIKSTRWILDAALWSVRKRAPNFNWVYVPHLDYAAQKFGPQSSQARASLVELDEALADFAAGIEATSMADDVVYLVTGEYALTEVSGVVYPNRILREAGLLALREDGDSELVDLQKSSAFAMVDHQVAHIYANRDIPQTQVAIFKAFEGVTGVARVCSGRDRSAIGLDHSRSGDVVLISDDDHWFAYYWWKDDAAAPYFARTVDIHSKPGYDPIELFVDPVSRAIPLDATLARGSHGVPVSAPRHKAALICSADVEAVRAGAIYRDIETKGMCLSLLGV